MRLSSVKVFTYKMTLRLQGVISYVRHEALIS